MFIRSIAVQLLMNRSDASRDDKAGTLVNSHRSLMELAAAVFYQACLNTREQSFEGKTLKREHAATRLKDGLVQGKILWNGSFYFLVHNFHLRIKKHLLIYWFEGISKNFERVLNDSNSTQSYDGMLWLLQSLQELSSLLSFCAPCKGTFQQFYLTSEEILLVRSGWHVIWSCLLHGLPIFSNLTPVADAALKLLSSIISNDLINLFNVPQDVWDLRIFRHMPSSFALQFVSIYFSSKCAQGNLPEVLQLRKNLLRAVLGLLKDPGALSEPVVWLLPASIFSLCTGCAPFKPSSPSCVEDMMEWMKKEENDQSIAHQLYDCSVEILAEIATESSVEVSHTAIHHGLRLPQQMRHSLTQEMEEYFLANVILYEEVEKFNLSDLFFLCGLLSNCIYYVFLTRLGESNSSLANKMVGHILKLLEQIVLVVENNCVELQQHRCLDTGSVFDVEGRTLTSLRCFLCCPLFRVWVNDADNNLHTSIMHVTERLLFALTKLFSESSQCTSKVECEAPVPCLISSPSNLVENPNPVYDAKVRHVDMELDVDDDSEDMDFFTVSGNNVPGTSFSSVEWKRELVSAISFFFSVSPDATWKVLFNLIGQEDDLKVCEVILFSLCEGYSCSAGTVSDLVCLMNHMLEVSVSPRLCSVGILTAVHSLLERLLLLFPRGKDETGKKFATGVLEQSLETLGDLLNKIAEIGLPDWSARIKLLECICCFVSLDPHIAQGMIERLLGMLQDTDFRVRFFLAKRIGILFQTWDGHDQLLQDISYNFGIQLVMASNEKLVKAGEVLDAGSNPRPFMETVLVSLAHIAFCSEKVESEVVFMMCVISAMDFRERELVKALLDDLSRKLLYANRTKYFEELMGSILARWVVCEVSLDALVEIQDHFNVTSETSCFMRSCCPWLLPTLILHKQTVNLNWVSMVIGQPISVLVKDYFVEIFSICMALLCSMKGDRENGAMVLRSYILQIAGISENQRDDLIKRHMVSIVSFLLSLSSSALDPAFPLFSKDVIVLSVRKVVDGFLEMDDHPMSFDIVDKINVFRPDRVFMFLVEIHNQITGAVHVRHKCHRLSAIEVLVNVIGQRSTVPSTSSYILNLIGQFIADGALQDQCCVILTTLLEVFYKNPVKDILGVLGEQLQFLISKLVACCISSNNLSETSSIRSMKVLILLHQLTVDADPFLYGYIKELEPFPELDCFERIRTFHLELCKLYSPKEHLLKLVKRAGELPRRLLLLSLQSLHKNPLLLEIIRPVRYSENINGKADCWQSDPDIVYAIWALVGMCDSDDTEVIGALVADFISMVGIGDPHRVVFHLPRHTNERFLCPQLDNNSERGICTFIDACVSDETLIKLIKLLKKYLLDASVKTVEITSQTLRGILSTDRGHGAMLSFDSYERSLIAVHTKGVNLEVVEKLLMEFQIRSSEAGSLDDSSLWSTHGKTYEMWICSLVYSLLNHGTDIILRLCQDIVLLKAEVAELLFPNVLVDIAMGKDSKVDICQKISEKVMEYVLFDSNDMIKSVKTMLNALNELRLFHVLERVGASSVQSSQEISKKARTSSYSRMRSTSERYKDQSSPTNVGHMSCILWTKVYWLCIDYLVVAKAAIRCGLYFTAVLFVEHWCEEHFNGLTLGESDFSLHEVLPAHIELLVAAITRINEPDSIYGIIQSHKLTSQIKMYEHEGDWGKVLEYYDLLIRMMPDKPSGNCSERTRPVSILMEEKDMEQWKSCKGLMRALQNTGCTHILDVYCRGLVNQKGHFQSDSEFTELQYEAAWRAGNWDFSLLPLESNYIQTRQITKRIHFNESVHSCLRALQEGDPNEFHMKINDSKKRSW
ncbi:Serine/threonine-protein kinase ATM [Acorus gramineus]|uniref:non-specific serine/threonine protein kinase n=1 Tax=Acorus gramineus TaxID=55184 RepID=A0AAV9BVV3_ACOGR|nr:Serine/threonine-protein kinase ATM [Acorus gramineus]